MRVYEFAKKTQVSSKDIIDRLTKAGFDVASHMSVLSDEMIAFLEKGSEKKEATTAPSQTTKKKTAEKKEEGRVVEVVSKAEKISPVAPPQKVEKKEVETQQPVTQPEPVAQPEKEKPVTPPQAAKPEVKPVAPAPAQQPPAFTRQQTPSTSQAKPFEYRPEPTTPVVQEPLRVEVRAMTPDDLAQQIKRPVNELVLMLLRKGVLATKNQLLSEKVVADMVRQCGGEAIFPTKAAAVAEKRLVILEGYEERKPVVVVMGHVDHGKTTLLDYIRKTRVAAREKGGITQHLGAYEVQTSHGGIVFLDTPGHEAFSQMRARGARVADIAILVVAADDSVKPQTVEALKHAKAIDVPIIVAVNKIDKVDIQRVDVVKRDLSQYELLPEEWGGSTIFVPVSAKVGTGIDQLLEIISLQAQVMELKAHPKGPGRGVVLESKLEKGLGPVATVLCQEGTISVGDFFVCGVTQGKVTLLVDSLGQRIKSAGPSTPIQVAGLEDIADVGDIFEGVAEADYRYARAKGDRKPAVVRPSIDADVLNLIVKADGNATREAVLGAINQLPAKGARKLNIVHSGIGSITESDVTLAANTGSLLIGLHIKVEPNAVALAQRHTVSIKLFDIIYRLLEDLQEMVKQEQKVIMIKQKTGEAEVRKVFDIKGLGVIAGCYVKSGRVLRDGFVVVWRGQEKVGQGKIKSLQREKKSIKEIQEGFECAFMVEAFSDWQEGDRVECFIEVPQAPKA